MTPVDDDRLERMRGLAAEAGLKEMASAIVELRFLRGLHNPETLEHDLVAALRQTMRDHGPVTEENVTTAAQSIIGALRARASSGP